MSLFQSNNPMMKEEMYQGSSMDYTSRSTSMTVLGTLKKFGVLMFLMFASAIYAWKVAISGGNIFTLVIVSIIGNLIVGFAMKAKPNYSHILAPVGALLEGLFVGAISALYEYKMGAAGGYTGIVPMAAGLTMAVGLAMFALYYFRIIKVTKRFKSIVMISVAGVGIFYLVVFLLSLFFGTSAIPGFIYQPTLLGIGFSLVMVVLASLKLLVDFDMVEEGATNNAPKYMEWYSGFALLVTIVWLYIEILRLLAKLSSRD